jgi:hypothetical protein
VTAADVSSEPQFVDTILARRDRYCSALNSKGLSSQPIREEMISGV